MNDDPRRRLLQQAARDQGSILGVGDSTTAQEAALKFKPEIAKVGLEMARQQQERTGGKQQLNALVAFAPNQKIEIGSINFLSTENPDQVQLLDLDENGIPTQDIVLNPRISLIPAGTFNGFYDSQDPPVWNYNLSAQGDQIWVRFKKPFIINKFNADPFQNQQGTNQDGISGNGPLLHIINLLFNIAGANPPDSEFEGIIAGGFGIVNLQFLIADFNPTQITFRQAAMILNYAFNPWGTNNAAKLVLSQTCTGNKVVIPVNNAQLDDPATRELYWNFPGNLNGLFALPPATPSSFTSQVFQFTQQTVKQIIGQYFWVHPFFGFLPGWGPFKIIGASDPLSGYNPSLPQQVIHFEPAVSAPSVINPAFGYNALLFTRPIYGFVMSTFWGVNSRGDNGNANPGAPFYGAGQVRIPSPVMDANNNKISPIELFES